MTIGVRTRDRTEYGLLNGPYMVLMGKYVRIYIAGGLTEIGRVCHADSDVILLSPSVVNVGVRGENKLRLNSGSGLESVVSVNSVMAAEVLVLDYDEGIRMLNKIVSNFNEGEKNGSDRQD